MLPSDIDERADVPSLFKLNDIILKACEQDLERRYKSAAEMHADLLRLNQRLQERPAKS